MRTPGCRPLYIDRISHYMPNSQRILVKRKGHGVLGGGTMERMVQAFLNDPMKKMVSTNPAIVVYQEDSCVSPLKNNLLYCNQKKVGQFTGIIMFQTAFD